MNNNLYSCGPGFQAAAGPRRRTGFSLLKRTWQRAASIAALTLGLSGSVTAQQSNLSCSLTSVPFVNGITPSFTVTQSTTNSGTSTWNLAARTIDADTTNFATGTIGLTGALTLRVTDAANTYASGDFAGFTLASSLINASSLGSLEVRTYLNGIQQEAVAGSNLIAVSAGISGAYQVGFYTNKSFNAIELSITNTLGVGSYFVYNAVLRGTGSCTSPALVCNTPTNPGFPAYAVVLDPARTGVTGLSVGALGNTAAVVDNDPTTYATLTTTTAVLGTAAVAVKDAVTDYPANTFAGFDLENATLLSTSVLGSITINTYRDGVLKQSRSGTGLLLGATIGGTTGRQTVGFAADSAFDEVQVVISQTGLVSLGTTRIYSAVLRRLCAGPALACNTPTTLSDATYPVAVNAANTGFSGAACVACSLTGTGNLVDADAATAATLVLTAGVLTSGQVSVRDAITDYTAGTFAGYDIANTSLLDLTLLSNVTISTYRDGVLKQTASGSGLTVAAPSSLTAGTGRITLGFVADSTFDEVRLALNQTVGVNLGTTTVYGPVLQRLCGGNVACNTVQQLTSPAQPVIINQRLTGVTGAVCALCAVNNPGNVLTASTTDYAQLVTTLGVAASTSLSVQNGVDTYPTRSIAGFTLGNPSQLVQATLLQSLTLATYNNGVFVESRTGTSLLNATLNIPAGVAADSIYSIGFVTTAPFDEVRISTTPVAGVAPVVNVYGAFVDTRYASALVGGTVCYKAPLAEPDHFGTPQNTTLTGSVSTNDRDPQGGTLTYQTTPATAPLHGTLTLSATGTFTYVPTAGYTGPDSFAYTVCNGQSLCSTAWVYVGVAAPRIPGSTNKPPMALADFSQTYAGVAVTGNAASNDVDPDGNPLTYTVLTAPRRGTLTLNLNGGYTYIPAAGFIGRDTATLQVCDNGTPALCASSRVIITVDPTLATGNRAPFAQNDVVGTSVGTAVTGNVLSNDSDPDGNTLTASAIGTVSAAQGTLTVNAGGGFTFQPATGFIGTVSIPYQACDGTTCDTASLVLVVQSNTAPLPLNLLSFTGTGRGCEAVLEWQTSNEEGVDRFEIETSTDGRAFRVIGTQEAANTPAGNRYRFVQEQTAAAAYYRLHTIDYSGAASYSSTVLVKTSCDRTSLSVSPNPTRGTITISGAAPASTIEVYSALGVRVLQTTATTANPVLDLQALPAGQYHLRIQSAAGTVENRTIAVQH